MILKILLKIWPFFVPILSYMFWVFVQNLVRNFLQKKLVKKDYIEGEFHEVKEQEKKTINEQELIKPFSLKNRTFIVVIYVSLFLLILSLIFSVIYDKPSKGQYFPATSSEGKIVPGYIEKD